MKKVFKFIVLTFFTVLMMTLFSCKKDANFMVKTSTTVPVLTTSAVTSIRSTSAMSGGNVTADGGLFITARGICWGTEVNPTISNSKTIDEFGIGKFTSVLTGLIPGTIYFVRAYATNSEGTVYGVPLSFTTTVEQVPIQVPAQGPWPQIANFPGGVRYSAACFSIGTKVYVGIGYDDGDWPIRDFWEWDQTTNVWTRKADYPGNSEGDAISFSIGAKGYIGFGSNFMTNGFTNEFWEYDPSKNSWIQKESLPGSPARAWAVGFSIGAKGYIGTGFKDAFTGVVFPDQYYQDFWEWDQATNVWTRKADFGGNGRYGAVAFSIGNKGYIGTGIGGGNILYNDFWEWDQATNTWTKKADFRGNSRGLAVGFSIGGKGYIGTGYDGGTTLYKDFWEWDQATNVWAQNTNFGGIARSAAVGFSIGNKGFAGTGFTGGSTYAVQDFWELTPK